MNRFAWQGLLPPAVLPLTVSVTVAMASAGVFGLGPNDAGDPASLVAEPTQISERPAPSEPDRLIATPTPNTSSDSVSNQATSEATETPPPAVSVPPATSPRPTGAAPTSAPTPAPTSAPTPPVTPAPTPPPIDEAEACALATAYAQSQIASVTIQVKSCKATQLVGRWVVEMRIKHPGCVALEAQGLPCANSPLKLSFWVREDRSVAAADAETQAILDTY